jgi:hypothetical protein
MAAKKKPVVRIDDGEWVTISWSGQHEECCECGLKHRVDFRVADGGKLQFRASRIK